MATPIVIFDDADNVIPDVVWISNERLAVEVDEEGHFTIAPDSSSRLFPENKMSGAVAFDTALPSAKPS